MYSMYYYIIYICDIQLTAIFGCSMKPIVVLAANILTYSL